MVRNQGKTHAMKMILRDWAINAKTGEKVMIIKRGEPIIITKNNNQIEDKTNG